MLSLGYNNGMALFMKQEEGRTELQKKLAAELQAKARQPKPGDLPDGVEDAAFVKGTKQTTSLAGVWVMIVLAIIVVLIWLVATAIG
ncbi:hypothetical protein CL689_07420 [Candidatus Saccharibacteria bacterium]|nr:hypothetical protein [Candidatus Saccharibacteria bacterium]|tara:strand:+ start:919 stop:1179 length:261 start_codon:yes stop_codon:yes gene_type:complete